jgi:hypothetical protein
VQSIVNEKAATPFGQRNFLNTLRAMFKWAAKKAGESAVGNSRGRLRSDVMARNRFRHLGRDAP